MGSLKYDVSEIQIPKFIQYVPSHIQAETLAKLNVLTHQGGDLLRLVDLSRIRGNEPKVLAK